MAPSIIASAILMETFFSTSGACALTDVTNATASAADAATRLLTIMYPSWFEQPAVGRIEIARRHLNRSLPASAIGWLVGLPSLDPVARPTRIDPRAHIGDNSDRLTNVSEGRNGHAAALAHPGVAFQREGPLDPRLQGHRAPTPGARPRLPDPRLACDAARHLANPVPGRPGDRRLDAHHRRARRAISRAAAVSRRRRHAGTGARAGRLLRRATRAGPACGDRHAAVPERSGRRAPRADDGHARQGVPEPASAATDLPGVLPLSSQDQRREAGCRPRRGERRAGSDRAGAARLRLSRWR